MNQTFGSGLSISLHTRDGEVLLGRLAATRMYGVGTRLGIELGERAQPACDPGEELELVIEAGPGRPTPMRARGRVVQRADDERGARLMVEVGPEVGGVLAPLASRRGEVRARPAGGSSEPAVFLRAAGGGEVARAELFDLSGHGLAVVLQPEDDARMGGPWRVEVALDLLGEDGELIRFVAAVRYRRPHGARVQLGLELDPAETPDFDARAACLIAYARGRGGDGLVRGADEAAD